MLKGYGVVSDYQIDRISSSILNDKTVLYFKMLAGEAAWNISDFQHSDSVNRIHYFTKFITDSSEDFAEKSIDWQLAMFPETIKKILQLVKADKQISNLKLAQAQAILNSVDNADVLSEVILYLKKKMHYYKAEYSISAQIQTKQNYPDLIRYQLLSELQSENDKMFDRGFERLISDDSIDNNLLFEAACILYTMPNRVDISQINSIFKNRLTQCCIYLILWIAQNI